ncbi:gibberellin 2-beta-dioxygenase 6-like [Wolffia australiana]
MEEERSEPPFEARYGEFFRDSSSALSSRSRDREGECELPLVDLSGLTSGAEEEREACAAAMAEASAEWGFFQVVNHGISRDLLDAMKREQKSLFRLPFEKKPSWCKLLNGSYRWGTPTATCSSQVSWSEAFHIPLSNLCEADPEEDFSEEGSDVTALWQATEKYAAAVSEVATTVARVLAEKVGARGRLPADCCSPATCFLRLNRYPRCRFPQEVFGLVPHTDSDFLTVLLQDHVGGLELMKDSRWVAVAPNPDALIVNIGDLFQAWSNDVYKSVEHRVLAAGETERYSVAYFMCPSFDSVIGSCGEPSLYHSFTFGEYRRQVQADVDATGRKIGLPRFLRYPAVSHISDNRIQ